MNEAALKNILYRLRGAGAELEAVDPEPQHPAAEDLVAQTLGEFQPDEADRIVNVWADILGIRLDRAKLKEHLEALRKWQAEWQARRGG